MPGPSRSVRHRDRDVDTARERSVSFAPPETRPPPRPATERQPVPVGPGRPWDALPRSGPLPDEALGYPVQLAKVQPPALRDETLERPRLLDWLHTKINRRVVLVIADAGYGKTTLLADFSRRTRLPTLWYRLDDDDRDWVSFMRHLVAAGREHGKDFGAKTLAQLSDDHAASPSKDVVLDTFIDELASISANGAAVVLDDFHLVDDAEECRHIVRHLVRHAPERLTVVFSSRALPSVPLGRLRAIGEVAELTTDDLRFDLVETSRLFSDTYGRDLGTDVVTDLAARTEGWIASLQLVHAALRDRSPSEIRRFVRDLSGADRDLYDFLAEEVVGDLSDAMQRFLMTTAVLQVLTPELARALSGQPAEEVGRLIGAAERLTLLSRVSGGPRTHLRYHPLVREFLEARLRSAEGPAFVADLHRKAASAAGSVDWRTAAHHYREAGDQVAVLETLDAAIPTIMSNAQYDIAGAFLTDFPAERSPSGTHLVISRVDMQMGDYDSAARSAQAVLEASGQDPVQRDHALLNLLAVSFNYGHGERALQFATSLRDTTNDRNLRAIAEASIAIMEVSSERDLDVVNRKLRDMAKHQRSGHAHHFGVSMYNLAANSVTQDRLDDAEREVTTALEAFASTSSIVERQAAEVLRISVLLRTGRQVEATSAMRALLLSPAALQNDSLLEAADAFDSMGSRELAEELLDRVGDRSVQTLADRRIAALNRARIWIRRGRLDDAEASLLEYPQGVSTVVGLSAARTVLIGHLALARHRADSASLLRQAVTLASEGGIHSARRTAEILLAAATGPQSLSRTVNVVGEAAPWHLTGLAEVLVPLLPSMDESARHVLAETSLLHPDRWRVDLRLALDDPATASFEAALLLEEIGDRSDVRRLRAYAKANRRDRRSATLGRSLARRMAEPVYVEDQLRVDVRIGGRTVAGSTIRRKVLALLCFLLTKPDLSATRDQVLDALWPDQDPDVATNSLNQTLYFLRRVFEEQYAEDLSPGYVHYESDVIWLDAELVSSRTVESRRMIRALPVRPSPDDVGRLTALYQGRFALEFEYEEWASAFRDSVHAAYLEIVERSLLEDVASGHHYRAIATARRALDVDPRSDHIEVALLRLYKATNAHAAAAEQYAHYSSVMRDELGIEPPPLDSL